MAATVATPKKPRPIMSLAPFQKKNEELIFRKQSIINMLKYMTDKDNSIQVIFDELTDKKNINNIKYYKLFNINERPILYVKSITINGIEIPIDLSFYKSTGTSRGDEAIKDYWFPTTKIRIEDGKYKLSKLEDAYLAKYENMANINTSRNIVEEYDLLKYGRFITINNALVGYFLYKNNNILLNSSFDPVNLEKLSTYKSYIPYTDFIQEPELTLTSEMTSGGKTKRRQIKRRKTKRRKTKTKRRQIKRRQIKRGKTKRN